MCANRYLRSAHALTLFPDSQELVGPEDNDRLRLLITQLSRRAIRRAPADEYISFARWVARKPYHIGYSSYGGMGQGFWGSEEEWEREYDEWNSDSENLSAVDADEDE